MKQTITCDNCGSTFERESREIKRSQKKGRKNFCSRICSGKANVSNLPEEKSGYNISLHASNKRDEYTGFRELLRRTRMRHHEVDIDLEYLVEIWEKQGGKCPYSGVDLRLPECRKICDAIHTASIDRINSSIGYVKNNIQFTSVAMNYMKNNMSHGDTLTLCDLIAKNRKV